MRSAIEFFMAIGLSFGFGFSPQKAKTSAATPGGQPVTYYFLGF